MPPRITPEEAQAKRAVELFTDLITSEQGVGVRHQLKDPLPGLPAGSWIFGRIALVKGKAVVTYEGASIQQPYRTSKNA